MSDDELEYMIGTLNAIKLSSTRAALTRHCHRDSLLPNQFDLGPKGKAVYIHTARRFHGVQLTQILPATPATVVGDYIREEKHFSYYLEIQAGSTWVEMANMKTAQELAVRRIAATGAVPTDFSGRTNYHNVGFIDCLISESEVRALVGGSDPIDITSGANA